MPFRARTTSPDGGFGSPLSIAGYDLTGSNQLFMGVFDEKLGFGVAPAELLERDDVLVEMLGGEPAPGSSAFRRSSAQFRLDHQNAVAAGEWPSDRELALQANVTAKLDPKTADEATFQYLKRGGMDDATATREMQRRKSARGGMDLLDVAKPIERRGVEKAPSAPKASSTGGPSAADAQAARDAAAKAGKGGKAKAGKGGKAKAGKGG